MRRTAKLAPSVRMSAKRLCIRLTAVPLPYDSKLALLIWRYTQVLITSTFS